MNDDNNKKLINIISRKLLILSKYTNRMADGTVLPTEEMSLARDMAVPVDSGTNLADILSSALPPDKRLYDNKDKQHNDSSVSLN